MLDVEKVTISMARFLNQPVTKLLDETQLTDLVTESFVLVEMVIELQEEFGIRLVQDDLRDVKTVRHLVDVLVRRQP